MARKKNIEEEKEIEKKLECDDHIQSDDEMIALLKQIVNQNEQVVQLLTQLKQRFI